MHKWFLVLYRLSLFLYPKDFRDAYAGPMLQTLADMLNDQPSKSVKARMWLRIAWDMQCSIIEQHIANKGVMLMNTSSKIATSAIWIVISAIASMLLPVLRGIGTTWTDLPGFLRVVVLLLYVVLCMGMPAVMAVLALFGYPRSVYKRSTSR